MISSDGMFVRAGSSLVSSAREEATRVPFTLLSICSFLTVCPIMGGVIPGAQSGIALRDSIMAVPVTPSGPGPHITRSVLTALEQEAPLNVLVSLRMRNFSELEGRIQAGETIAPEEMESRYLPLREDYTRAAAWLEGEGLARTLNDNHHTNLYVRGSIAKIAEVFSVTFARVATMDGEFTSAVSIPSVPSDLKDAVLGILGLQPHIRLQTNAHLVANVDLVAGYVTPSDVLAAYSVPVSNDANGSPIIGSGQTIAVIMDAAPLQTDLSAFWQAAGINGSLANYALENVNGGPTSASQTSDANEASLDAEWASGIAPGANIRFYAIPTLAFTDIAAACTQIANDGGVNIVSISAAGRETDNPPALLQAGTQVTAQLAASGITILAGSGDGGSNPNAPSQGSGYVASNPLTPSYPASDPNLTSVGGTTTNFNSSLQATSELVWSEIGRVSTTPMATGGGISSYFSRPAWQVGSGVPAGSYRCVPDVSSMAEAYVTGGGYAGAFIVLNGSQSGVEGTSLSTPVWAGVVAMLNQYRASFGLKAIGLLNRWTYALIGTNAFNDVTVGNNGAYSAGLGYDLCTGVGSPNIAQFINQTTKEIFQVSAPTSPVAAGTSVTLSVTPQFTPSTYQWRLNGANIAGATNSAYLIASASAADAGTYTVVITNAQLGAVTYSLGTLSVKGLTANNTRLVNISTRAQVGTGGNILIPGFVISGSGTETLLIRADGPGLSQFGVSGVLAQPSLSVFNSSGAVVATNTGWGTSSNASQIASTAAVVGAFALSPGSADSAVIVGLSAGSYTVQVSGVGNTTGVALAEIYEVSSTGTRLINVSTRTQVGTGGNILIPGFVIGGSGTEQLLVRGDGPSLAQFNVSGYLAQPSLSLLSGTTTVAANTGWGTSGNPAQIASVGASVGAFTLTASSADSAMIVNLQPGAYTVQVSGVNNTTGVALAEIYEVP